MVLDVTSFAYAVLLVGGLVSIADWLAPYENLSAQGCFVDFVYDGDTVALNCAGEVLTARLIGFDTPEVKAPGGRAEARRGAKASDRLRSLVQGGAVTLSGTGRDKYARLLVTLRVDGVDVGDTLIAQNLAVAYRGGARPDWCDRLRAR